MTEPNPPVILGVDGGQSGIRMRTSLSESTIEIEGVSHQDGDTISLIARAVGAACRRGAFVGIDRVVLGLTTVPATAPERDRLCVLVAQAAHAPEVWVMDDTVSAHYGALSGRWGVSLIAGTGVAAMALSRDGEHVHVFDGHGFLLGDDGGAFWIGRAGVRAVLRSLDGRGAGTALTEFAAQRYDGLDELHVRLHSQRRPVNAIAQFTRDVFAAARGGDAVAGDILDDAAEQLAVTAQTAVAGVAVDEPVPLALGGRLFEPGSILRSRFDVLMRSSDQQIAVQDAHGSSLDGALALGSAARETGHQRLIHTWSDSHAQQPDSHAKQEESS
jgi:N-acetylglucosamine kinase-like BadF-type ATPase